MATHIPEARRSVVDCVLAAGGTVSEAKAFGRLFGIDTVAVTPVDQTVQDIFGALIARVVGGAVPDTVIYVHGNPVQPGADGVVLGHVRALLVGVERAYEMDQQNCSTLFWALEGARLLLAAGTARCVLILAGDGMNGLAAGERYAPGCTAIGDGYVALLVDAQPGGVRLSVPFLATRAVHHSGRFGTADEVQAFNAGHSGFVGEILQGLGTGMAADGPPLLGHNVNRLSWAKFCKDTGFDRDRIRLDLLPDVGHCYTADAFLMLPKLVADGKEGDLLSVGQGGFLAGCKVMGVAHAGA